MSSVPFTLAPERLLGGINVEAARAPIYDAVWYTADSANDGLAYYFPVGALAGMRYLAADMLLSGETAGVFALELQEGEHGSTFALHYALLPEASARMRLPLDATNMNRWLYEREGAWVKPRTAGERVNLAQVDRMRIRVIRMGDEPLRWCMTPIIVTVDEPLPLPQPVLPWGKLLDELGQSALHNWPGKSFSVDEVVERLHGQVNDAQTQGWPEGFSKWGGWKEKRFDATGFFRTQWDGNRWWLVDPDGCAFWSAGVDCVRSEIEADITGLAEALAWLPDERDYELATIVRWQDQRIYANFLQANLMHAFGPNAWHTQWTQIVLSQLHRMGFNTVGNWSEWDIASDARFPYVRPLRPLPDPQAPMIYRDLPDVFDPLFEADAARFAEQLKRTLDDPALIGYFLMNEPEWAFASESPAAGMLYTSEANHTRRALADFLRERYGDEVGLTNAWGMPVTFGAVEQGRWQVALTEPAIADLEDFSAAMIETYFNTLNEACRQIDPNHLNLGVRYYTVPPDWCMEAMRGFDVFSMNCYRARVPAESLQTIHETLNLPTLIGEFHMGALDVGLPATGVGPRLRNQTERGQAYRVYVENAAVLPWCVGVHYFTLYDQPALGRFDGEAYNIGFLDICHRPYEEMVAAARQAHRHMYAVALGDQPPFDDLPEVLPPLYF